METSGVGCAIPVWRSSMPCSVVPPFVPVRFVVVRSLLPKVHLYGSHAPLPENKRLSPFLMVHTEKRACAPFRGYRNRPDGAAASSGNHDCLSSGTTTTALALQPCMCWSTTAIICGGGKQKPKHAFAEPGMWLTSWPSTSTPAVPSVWYHE